MNSAKKFICYKCSSGFVSGNLLSQHLAKDHGVSKKCEYCNYETDWYSRLIKHEKKCKEMQKLSCHKCEKYFSNKRLLGHHLSKAHGKLTKCEYCDYTCKFPKYMIKHEQVCKDMPNKYACKICDCKFSTEMILRFHNVLKHKNKRNTSSEEIREVEIRLEDCSELICKTCNNISLSKSDV